jgi:hypothetical protein
MSEDHIAVAINGVLYVKFEDAKKLREGWDKADAEIEKLRAALREIRNKARTGRPPFMSSKTDFFQIASKALGEKDDAKV